MSELRECPFAAVEKDGGHVLGYEHQEEGLPRVACSCGARGPVMLNSEKSAAIGWNRRAPVDSVGVDREKVLNTIPTNWLDPLLTGPERALPDKAGKWGCPDIESLLSAIKDRIRAALTAPADGCPACGANWDSEHNRCEGNCDKLLSEKEG